MMDEFTHGGTPPTLWMDRDHHRHITHHMDIYCSRSQYELRIQKLADQVEKLSWMLETSLTIEEAEKAWLVRNE